MVMPPSMGCRVRSREVIGDLAVESGGRSVVGERDEPFAVRQVASDCHSGDRGRQRVVGLDCDHDRPTRLGDVFDFGCSFGIEPPGDEQIGVPSCCGHPGEN